MGSSGASAVAAAFGVNQLLGKPLSNHQLIEVCIEVEARVSGRHADNVAPCLLGGLLLIRSLSPLDIISLPILKKLTFVVVTPKMEIATKAARDMLPKTIPLKSMVHNSGNLASMIAAFHSGDFELLARSLTDEVVEPARAHLIPGFHKVKASALEAGAMGCSMSGSGPSVFALCIENASLVARAMTKAFLNENLKSQKIISPISLVGAREIL